MADAPEEAVWRLRPPPPLSTIAALSRALSLPPMLAHVLAARGFDETKLAYLEPPLVLSDIPNLKAAAERLALALRAGKRILIHGDYDADGISGTALLTLGLRALGGDVTPFIPNRLTDGYGIHPERVAEHAERAELMLTVDCGIGNLAEIAALQQAGVEVIVTDHHTPGEQLPRCLIVHPKLSPSARQGLPALTGAGVAFQLLWALHAQLGLEPPLAYSDIAALGTIADVAPLLGENRALVREGLKRLRESCWPGVRAMVAQSRISGEISAREVAFVLAPRLNAAGRLGEAEAALELLMTASERRARELAVYLEARNSERKRVQEAMFEEALAEVEPAAPALILSRDHWHPGVMGIVASKLLERFYKPVFIIAQGKGSVRSTPGISAVAALRHAAPYLKRFGGHSQAAGFAIEMGQLAGFRRAICEFVGQHPAPRRTLLADALLDVGDIDDDLYRAIVGLEPFGEGHAPPTFLLTELLELARAVGEGGRTLQLKLGGVRGVAWQLGGQAAALPLGSPVQAAVQLRENDWNGRSLEFIAEGVRPAVPCELAASGALRPAIYRGKPPGAALLLSSLEQLGDDPSLPLHLKALPLAEGLAATAPLRQLLARPNPLYFDLEEPALAAARARAAALPTIADVRRAVVALQRGQALPFDEAKRALVWQVLAELELLRPNGSVVRGEKRDPYASATLRQSLLERHAIHSVLLAYLHLSEAAFAESLARLFAERLAQPERQQLRSDAGGGVGG